MSKFLKVNNLIRGNAFLYFKKSYIDQVFSLVKVWIHERFTRDITLQGNFDSQTLPNFKKFWTGKFFH